MLRRRTLPWLKRGESEFNAHYIVACNVHCTIRSDASRFSVPRIQIKNDCPCCDLPSTTVLRFHTCPPPTPLTPLRCFAPDHTLALAATSTLFPLCSPSHSFLQATYCRHIDITRDYAAYSALPCALRRCAPPWYFLHSTVCVNFKLFVLRREHLCFCLCSVECSLVTVCDRPCSLSLLDSPAVFLLSFVTLCCTVCLRFRQPPRAY